MHYIQEGDDAYTMKKRRIFNVNIDALGLNEKGAQILLNWDLFVY